MIPSQPNEQRYEYSRNTVQNQRPFVESAIKAKYGPEQCTAARKALGLLSPIPDDKASAMAQWLEANARPLAAMPTGEPAKHQEKRRLP